jgi:hypothetical protein
VNNAVGEHDEDKASSPKPGLRTYRFGGQADAFIITYLAIMVFLGGVLSQGKWPPAFSLVVLTTSLLMWLFSRFVFGSKIILGPYFIEQKSLLAKTWIDWNDISTIVVKTGGYSKGLRISEKIILGDGGGRRIRINSMFSDFKQLEDALETQLRDKSAVSLQEARVKAEGSVLSWICSLHREDLPELLTLTALFFGSFYLALLCLR